MPGRVWDLLIRWLKSPFVPSPLEAIVFKPIHPPQSDPANLTYFGGYPTLSKHLAWPLDERGCPLLFIGQVELSKLPQFARRNGSPAAGVLHFFGDSEDGESAVVLFSTDSTERLVETPPPQAAPDVFRSYPLNKLDWARPAVSRPNAYPKWWMEPVPCRTRSFNDLQTSTESFARTFPPPASVAATPPFPEAIGARAPELWIPDATFPYLWVYIETWCNQLLADQVFMHLNKEPQQDPHMAQECHDWIKRAQLQGRLIPTTAAEVGEFWSWVRSLVTRRDDAVPMAAVAERARRITKRTATPADRAELLALLKRPGLAWRNALRTIPQQAEKFALGELQGNDAKLFLAWLDGLEERGTSTLNDITRTTIQVITNLLLGYSPAATSAIPAPVIEANRTLHWPRVERRHQMFGHRQALYDYEHAFGRMQLAKDRYAKTHHLLMQFSSSDGMCWTWGDVGEYLFWITKDDLRNGRFDRVIAAIECS